MTTPLEKQNIVHGYYPALSDLSPRAQSTTTWGVPTLYFRLMGEHSIPRCETLTDKTRKTSPTESTQPMREFLFASRDQHSSADFHAGIARCAAPHVVRDRADDRRRQDRAQSDQHASAYPVHRVRGWLRSHFTFSSRAFNSIDIVCFVLCAGVKSCLLSNRAHCRRRGQGEHGEQLFLESWRGKNFLSSGASASISGPTRRPRTFLNSSAAPSAMRTSSSVANASPTRASRMPYSAKFSIDQSLAKARTSIGPMKAQPGPQGDEAQVGSPHIGVGSRSPNAEPAIRQRGTASSKGGEAPEVVTAGETAPFFAGDVEQATRDNLAGPTWLLSSGAIPVPGTNPVVALISQETTKNCSVGEQRGSRVEVCRRLLRQGVGERFHASIGKSAVGPGCLNRTTGRSYSSGDGLGILEPGSHTSGAQFVRGQLDREGRVIALNAPPSPDPLRSAA